MSDLYNAALLALGWFAAVNTLLSLTAWGAWRAVRGRDVSAGALLGLRLLPAAGSILFTVAVFAPTHWRFEPRGTGETFGFGVHLLAALGLVLLVRSGWRLASVASASRTLARSTALQRLQAGGAEIFEVDGMTGVSLAGVLRPRIFVGSAVRRALTPAELDAAIAHEMAHDAYRDNWKRLAIACAPDIFGRSSAARDIERRWSALAECRADARAAAGDATRAAHLASALVKVARLGVAAPPSAAWSTLHDEPLLAERVHRLVGDETPAVPRAGRSPAIAFCLLVLAVAASDVWLAASLHELTETLAHLLP